MESVLVDNIFIAPDEFNKNSISGFGFFLFINYLYEELYFVMHASISLMVVCKFL